MLRVARLQAFSRRGHKGARMERENPMPIPRCDARVNPGGA